MVPVMAAAGLVRWHVAALLADQARDGPVTMAQDERVGKNRGGKG